MFELVLDMLFDTSTWKNDRKYVIRRRWFFGAIAVIAFAVLSAVVSHIWWTPTGYCWGDMMECMFPAEGGK